MNMCFPTTLLIVLTQTMPEKAPCLTIRNDENSQSELHWILLVTSIPVASGHAHPVLEIPGKIDLGHVCWP